MKQKISFCRLPSGANLAYSVVGTGPPLVMVRGWVGHLELDWEWSYYRKPIEMLAQHFTVVRYDKLGTGLSDRNYQSLTLEARLEELEALVQTLGLKTFALHGVSEGGPTAIRYAAKHADKVTRLVLYGTFASGSSLGGDDTRQAFLDLVRTQWERGSQLLTGMFMWHGPSQDRETFENYQQQSATSKTAATLLEAAFNADVTDDLAAVQAPTLVFHVTGDRAVPFDLGRKVAAGIPNAQLVPVPGYRHMPSENAVEEIYQHTIDFFLSDDPLVEAVQISTSLVGETKTIGFMDIAESTRLTREMGEEEFQRKRRGLLAEISQAVLSHGGEVAKGYTLGDGLLAVFQSVCRALDAGSEAAKIASRRKLPIRAGFHAGDCTVEAGTAYGDVVNLAARVQAKAEVGDVYVSATVKNLAGSSCDMRFEDKGVHELEGYPESYTLYRVHRPD